MIKLTEKTIQSSIMSWAMNVGNYEMVLPNSNQFLHWEADVLAVNKNLLLCEYEIKITRADYKKDFEKKFKHSELFNSYKGKYNSLHHGVMPNYFCYVTTFDIEPPEYAGWIKVQMGETSWHSQILETTFMKKAPQIHKQQLSDRNLLQIGHLASFQLMKYAKKAYPYFEERVKA